jgi:phosphoribosylformylglycinamidine synthase
MKTILVRKKPGFRESETALLNEWKLNLQLDQLDEVAIYQKYSVENISDELLEQAKVSVFSEPFVEEVFESLPVSEIAKTTPSPKVPPLPNEGEFLPEDATPSKKGEFGELSFEVALLPGQYDNTADWAGQLIQIIDPDVSELPIIKTSTVYVLFGDITAEQLESIKNYAVNPVDSTVIGLNNEFGTDFATSADKDTNSAGLKSSFLSSDLTKNFRAPSPCSKVHAGSPALKHFPISNKSLDFDLHNLIDEFSLAMDEDDLRLIVDYANAEGRDITETELKVLDTYWSDHCRHTTFGTIIDEVQIDDPVIQKVFEEYLEIREQLEIAKTTPSANAATPSKPKGNITLMNLATVMTKYLKATNPERMKNFDESEEINACSFKAKVKYQPVDAGAGTGVTQSEIAASQAPVRKAHCNDGQSELVTEDYLIMFKNETHNHPTEIEPFGGAATCLGGAIRDPLSGRSFVYQSMRISGAADPRTPYSETLEGKLPQKKICQVAAKGFSSYGNQIGLTTGQVVEVYHPDYVAKRMELGAVIAAAPASNVIRKRPEPGDVVILLGGATGADGIGGATGSSKEHTVESVETQSAEVQKGNPIEERKIQRLFRKPEVTQLIKRCNDFGAGGVAVAVGELAPSLDIYLDKVRKKYDGLSGTDLAISESQERMAVVVDPKDAEQFIELCKAENLHADVVADVTDSGRLRMFCQGETIVDLCREFIDSNGAEKHTFVKVVQKAGAVCTPGAGDEVTRSRIPQALRRLFAGGFSPAPRTPFALRGQGDFRLSPLSPKNPISSQNDQALRPGPKAESQSDTSELSPGSKAESQAMLWKSNLSQLNNCYQGGLGEQFDSTVGALNVLSPFGGDTLLTPADVMASRVPVEGGISETVSVMSHGFNPELSKANPFLGAYYAVIESVSKVVAAGVKLDDIFLSFQEYFPALKDDPEKWGLPFSALLGALKACLQLSLPPIGGKDSMSGTYHDLEVPPTLVSFAAGVTDQSLVKSNVFSTPGSFVYLLLNEPGQDGLLDAEQLKSSFGLVNDLLQRDDVLSVSTIKNGGISAEISKKCFGDKVGFSFSEPVPDVDLFVPYYGSFLIESTAPLASSFLSDDNEKSSNQYPLASSFLSGDLTKNFRAPSPCSKVRAGSPALKHFSILDKSLDSGKLTLLGKTTDSGCIEIGDEQLGLDELIESYTKPLEEVY